VGAAAAATSDAAAARRVIDVYGARLTLIPREIHRHHLKGEREAFVAAPGQRQCAVLRAADRLSVLPAVDEGRGARSGRQTIAHSIDGRDVVGGEIREAGS